MQNTTMVAEQAFFLLPVPIELVLEADLVSGNMLRMRAEDHKLTIESYSVDEEDETATDTNDLSINCTGDCDNCLMYDICDQRLEE